MTWLPRVMIPAVVRWPLVRPSRWFTDSDHSFLAKHSYGWRTVAIPLRVSCDHPSPCWSVSENFRSLIQLAEVDVESQFSIADQ